MELRRTLAAKLCSVERFRRRGIGEAVERSTGKSGKALEELGEGQKWRRTSSGEHWQWRPVVEREEK